MSLRTLQAGAVSAIVFLQGTVFAHAAQTNFWTDRQNARTVLARADAASSSDAENLLASLPAAQRLGQSPALSGQSGGLSKEASLRSQKNKISAHVPDWLHKSVAPFARLHAVHLAKDSNAKTIVLLE